MFASLRFVAIVSLSFPFGFSLGCSSSDGGASGADQDAALDSGVTLDAGGDGAPGAETGGDSDNSTDGGSDTGTSSDGASDTSSKVTRLRVHYPAGSGHTLSIRGSGGPWNWTKGVTLRAEADDTWTIETDTLTAKTEWKPLLDDATWSRGPNYAVSPGETRDVYPHFTQVGGKVEVHWPKFHSTTLGNDRGIWVYYPPTYLENSKARFPVVYMHDGQNLFDPSTAFGGNEWKVDETMDGAAEDGSIREAIVIGVENTSARMSEYTPTKDASVGDGGGADNYLKMLTTELKPMVDGALRTETGRESTAIMGSSLGGLLSSYAGTTSAASTFGLVGAMSPSTWWDGTVILKDVAAAKGKAPSPLRVYVDSGDSGTSSDDLANTKVLAQTYRDDGYVDGSTLSYVVQKGASHSEFYWAQRLPGALTFLLGAGR